LLYCGERSDSCDMECKETNLKTFAIMWEKNIIEIGQWTKSRTELQD
jgi:hypothetical protein